MMLGFLRNDPINVELMVLCVCGVVMCREKWWEVGLYHCLHS